jgi:hypothetical protein
LGARRRRGGASAEQREALTRRVRLPGAFRRLRLEFQKAQRRAAESRRVSDRIEGLQDLEAGLRAEAEEKGRELEARMHAREQQLAEEREAVEDAQRERERQLRERVDDEARRRREMAKQAQALAPYKAMRWGYAKAALAFQQWRQKAAARRRRTPVKARALARRARLPGVFRRLRHEVEQRSQRAALLRRLNQERQEHEQLATKKRSEADEKERSLERRMHEQSETLAKAREALERLLIADHLGQRGEIAADLLFEEVAHQFDSARRLGRHRLAR